MLKKHIIYLLIILITLMGLIFILNKADKFVNMPLVKPVEYLNEDEKAAKQLDDKMPTDSFWRNLNSDEVITM